LGVKKEGKKALTDQNFRGVTSVKKIPPCVQASSQMCLYFNKLENYFSYPNVELDS